jgi:hypothetical protein
MTMVRRLHREEKDEGGVRHLTKHPCLRTRIPVVSRVGDGGNPNPSSWPPLLLLPRAATRTGRRKVARPVGKAAAWLFPFFPVDLVGARPAISRRKLTGTPPPARQRWAPSTRSGFSPTGSGGCATGMRGGVGGGGGRSWVATTAAMAAWTAPATAATTGVGEGPVVAPRVVASVASCWPRLDGCCGWLRRVVAGCGGGRSWLWLAG